MKKLNLLITALLIFSVSALVAQETNDVLKTKTKSNQSNDRTMVTDTESLTVKVRTTDNGVEVAFAQAIVSPRDAASGLPTGKRQHKPYVFTKQYDKSSPVLAKSGSGGGSGKASMSDLSVMFTARGRTTKLPVSNGTFTLPADGKDDDCDLVLSWSWGETQSGSNKSKASASFKVSVQDGALVSVKEK